MVLLRPSSLALLGLAMPTVFAQQAGTFTAVGSTLVSALMMFLGSPDKVYILDKVEGNPTQINGHSAFASVWDLNTRTATPIDAQTNPFCAAGMHLPNGSFAVFGGNTAVGPGGNDSDPGSTTAFDPKYGDYDGTRAIRIITSCEGAVTAPPCSWYDAPNGLQMARHRWYPGAEALPNGTIVLIGGFTAGGYINRNLPNVDPTNEGGQAEPTYEFFPPGLNAYALTYLMPSGKMFVQANFSTILWDYNANVETPLPDMPGQVIRVYPASGANAMLPLTPRNGYNPTILFCGGQVMEDNAWGNYGYPNVDTWTVAASPDCHRITPEPTDGSAPAYVQDDNLPVGRTMGQFIALPDGTLLLLNGGYMTGTTPTLGQMPYGPSLATGPVFQPVIYNPNAPAGSRWSSAGLGNSTIPRLYHSTALLLPDGSIMVAGSNPNPDVNTTTHAPRTEKRADDLSYGGNPFDITVPSSSYTGDSNNAAGNTTVWLIRPGFTTHAMNLGQRSMQLNNTYTVQSDGTIIIHTAQLPPYPNLFQPGPALLFVTINGIPSNGTFVTVGNGQISTQPTAPTSVLPASVRSQDASGKGNGTGDGNGKKNGAATSMPHSVVGSILVSFAAVALTLALS
ncbi:glyoxal oxidase N-terminus-domain-containing protein [Russula vinacea]|nr:glyoxal oxidase N-terminus-domain-containing protein [Russula vinacea]